MRVPRDSGHDCCVALTGEQASNAALIVHLITFGLAIVFVGVAIWRRLRRPRRPALRYLVGACGLV